eukprot:jgi/Botrbrau1/8819/Bobra.0335s0009.1
MKIHAGSYTGPHMHICFRPRKLLVNSCSLSLTAHLACKPGVYAPPWGPATIVAVRGNWGRPGLSVLSALSDNERGPVEEELRVNVDSSISEKHSAEEVSVHPEDFKGCDPGSVADRDGRPLLFTAFREQGTVSSGTNLSANPAGPLGSSICTNGHRNGVSVPSCPPDLMVPTAASLSTQSEGEALQSGSSKASATEHVASPRHGVFVNAENVLQDSRRRSDNLTVPEDAIAARSPEDWLHAEREHFPDLGDSSHGRSGMAADDSCSEQLQSGYSVAENFMGDEDVKIGSSPTIKGASQGAMGSVLGQGDGSTLVSTSEFGQWEMEDEVGSSANSFLEVHGNRSNVRNNPGSAAVASISTAGFGGSGGKMLDSTNGDDGTVGRPTSSDADAQRWTNVDQIADVTMKTAEEMERERSERKRIEAIERYNLPKYAHLTENERERRIKLAQTSKWNTGSKWSDEMKELIRERTKAAMWRPDVRAKVLKTRPRIPRAEETKAKIAMSMRKACAERAHAAGRLSKEEREQAAREAAVERERLARLRRFGKAIRAAAQQVIQECRAAFPKEVRKSSPTHKETPMKSNNVVYKSLDWENPDYLEQIKTGNVLRAAEGELGKNFHERVEQDKVRRRENAPYSPRKGRPKRESPKTGKPLSRPRGTLQSLDTAAESPGLPIVPSERRKRGPKPKKSALPVDHRGPETDAEGLAGKMPRYTAPSETEGPGRRRLILTEEEYAARLELQQHRNDKLQSARELAARLAKVLANIDSTGGNVGGDDAGRAHTSKTVASAHELLAKTMQQVVSIEKLIAQEKEEGDIIVVQSRSGSSGSGSPGLQGPSMGDQASRRDGAPRLNGRLPPSDVPRSTQIGFQNGTVRPSLSEGVPSPNGITRVDNGRAPFANDAALSSNGSAMSANGSATSANGSAPSPTGGSLFLTGPTAGTGEGGTWDNGSAVPVSADGLTGSGELGMNGDELATSAHEPLGTGLQREDGAEGATSANGSSGAGLLGANGKEVASSGNATNGSSMPELETTSGNGYNGDCLPGINGHSVGPPANGSGGNGLLGLNGKGVNGFNGSGVNGHEVASPADGPNGMDYRL